MFKKIISLSLILILSLTVAEYSTRLFYKDYRYPLRYDQELGWVYIEKAYHSCGGNINSKGLRSDEYEYHKINNVTRILVLGDSFLEGACIPLKNIFSKQLENLLNNNSQRYYEVINAGFSMYGNEQELIFLKKEGIKYEPDIILLGLYPTNDPGDNINWKSRLTFRNRLHFFFNAHLNLYVILYRFIHFEEVKYISICESWDVFKKDFSSWDRTFEVLKEMKNLTESTNAKFVIFLIPNKRQVEDNLFRSSLEYCDVDKNEIDMEKPHDVLVTFANKNNIPILDLLPSMEAYNLNNTFYFGPWNSHWNGQGHKFAAESVYEFLKEQEML